MGNTTIRIKRFLYVSGKYAYGVMGGLIVLLGLLSGADFSRPPFSHWPEGILGIVASLKDYSLMLYGLIVVLFFYRQPPRSIGAIPIEVHGKIWGALVLDSKAPQGVTNEKIANFKLTAGMIGQLLEKNL